MDRFLCIQAFVQVAKTQSFVTTARHLGVAPSVITHRIKQLEGHLRAPLLRRSTRKVTLLTVGEEVLEECVAIVEKIDSLPKRVRALPLTARAAVECP